jgi:hypothetical protein
MRDDADAFSSHLIWELSNVFSVIIFSSAFFSTTTVAAFVSRLFHLVGSLIETKKYNYQIKFVWKVLIIRNRLFFIAIIYHPFPTYSLSQMQTHKTIREC